MSWSASRRRTDKGGCACRRRNYSIYTGVRQWFTPSLKINSVRPHIFSSARALATLRYVYFLPVVPRDDVVVLERATEAIQSGPDGDVDHAFTRRLDEFEILQTSHPARVRHGDGTRRSEKLDELQVDAEFHPLYVHPVHEKLVATLR